MSDIAANLKEQLRKGYELGDGSLCLVSARDLELFIAEIERLTATLKEQRELYRHDVAKLMDERG